MQRCSDAPLSENIFAKQLPHGSEIMCGVNNRFNLNAHRDVLSENIIVPTAGGELTYVVVRQPICRNLTKSANNLDIPACVENVGKKASSEKKLERMGGGDTRKGESLNSLNSCVQQCVNISVHLERLQQQPQPQTQEIQTSHKQKQQQIHEVQQQQQQLQETHEQQEQQQQHLKEAHEQQEQQQQQLQETHEQQEQQQSKPQQTHEQHEQQQQHLKEAHEQQEQQQQQQKHIQGTHEQQQIQQHHLEKTHEQQEHQQQTLHETHEGQQQKQQVPFDFIVTKLRYTGDDKLIVTRNREAELLPGMGKEASVYTGALNAEGEKDDVVVDGNPSAQIDDRSSPPFTFTSETINATYDLMRGIEYLDDLMVDIRGERTKVNNNNNNSSIGSFFDERMVSTMHSQTSDNVSNTKTSCMNELLDEGGHTNTPAWCCPQTDSYTNTTTYQDASISVTVGEENNVCTKYPTVNDLLFLLDKPCSPRCRSFSEQTHRSSYCDNLDVSFYSTNGDTEILDVTDQSDVNKSLEPVMEIHPGTVAEKQKILQTKVENTENESLEPFMEIYPKSVIEKEESLETKVKNTENETNEPISGVSLSSEKEMVTNNTFLVSRNSPKSADDLITSLGSSPDHFGVHIVDQPKLNARKLSDGSLMGSEGPHSPRSHSPRSQSPRSHSPRSHSPRSQSPRSHSPRSQSPRSHSPRSHSPRSHSPRSHSPRSHSPRSHSPRSDSPRSHSPRSTGSTNGSSRNQNVSRPLRSREGSSSSNSIASSEVFNEIVRNPSVTFDKETMSLWYKPKISREEATKLLQDKCPGAFLVRDSQSFEGGFGLALKVETPPCNVLQQVNGDITKIDYNSELVRHYLIEPCKKGVRLKGSSNETAFPSLMALIYQHSMTKMSLPVELVIPVPLDPNGGHQGEQLTEAEILEKGACCNLVYLGGVDVESLTGDGAIHYALNKITSQNIQTTTTTINIKVDHKGITLTDNDRRVFFRRHYMMNNVLHCGIDPEGRKINLKALLESCNRDVECFGFVVKKETKSVINLAGNECHICAEIDPNQPASAVINFIHKAMRYSKV